MFLTNPLAHPAGFERTLSHILQVLDGPSLTTRNKPTRRHPGTQARHPPSHTPNRESVPEKPASTARALLKNPHQLRERCQETRNNRESVLGVKIPTTDCQGRYLSSLVWRLA
jgi:hypothetical protein